jgi:hypothetical protein
MTAISWSSAGSGLWQVASNWSPAQVPGASDTATIGVAGVITVTSNADVTVGTTIVDANMTLAIDSNTTLHTTDGSTQAQGAIKVNNGGTSSSARTAPLRPSPMWAMSILRAAVQQPI